jgi:hypothetical protein
MEMKTYCVYHVIHTQTPYELIPQLAIDDVPDNTKITWEILERGGYSFGEFNIPRANHTIEVAEKLPVWVKRISYKELEDKK